MKVSGRVRRTVGFGAVVGLIASVLPPGSLGGSPTVPAAVASTPAQSAPAERTSQSADVVGLASARLLDTRTGPSDETVDAAFQGGGAIAAGTFLPLSVTGRGGVPADDVAAVVLNVTAVGPHGAGYLTVYSCDSSRPTASNLNYLPGDVVPNAVLAPVAADGTTCIYSHADTDVVADVTGYVPATSGVTTFTPARLADTRDGPANATVDGVLQGGGPLAGETVLAVAVAGRAGVPASGVAAVTLNVTAVAPAGPGHLTVYPCDTDRPTASNVNYLSGDVVPNMVFAPLAADGTVCIYTRAATHVVVDVNGYVNSGAEVGTLAPQRLLDTRSGPANTTIDGGFQGIGRRPAGTVLELDVVGRGDVPAGGVGALMLNVTAIGPDEAGYMTVFPCGTERPKASNVNYRAGDVVPNAVLARVGNAGKVCVYTLATTDVVVDVNGWFALPPNQPDSTVNVLDAAEAEVTAGGPDTGGASIRTQSGVAVGDLLVATASDGQPYYGRVTEASGEVVETEEVALAEIIPVMDLQLSADTNDGSVDVSIGEGAVEDFTVAPAAGQSLGQYTQAIHNPQVSCSSAAKATAEVSVEANAGHFVFDVSLNRWKTGIGYARVGYNPYVTAHAGLSASAGAECQFSGWLGSTNLPTIRFSIYGVPVWITQQLDYSLEGTVHARATGSAQITATASAWVGMTYADGNWSREASFSFEVDRSADAALNWGFTLAVPKVRYGARLYGVAGLDATVWPEAKFVYDTSKTKYAILTAAVKLEIELIIKLDLKVLDINRSHKFPTATVWGPTELWSASTPTPTTTTTTTTVAPTTTTTPPTTTPPPPDYRGKIIRDPNQNAYFVNSQGLREWIPDTPTWDCEIGRGVQVVNVSQAVVNSIPETGWHYCLNRANLHNKVLRHLTDGDAHYIHPDNTKTWIPDAATYNCRVLQGVPVVNTRWREYINAFTGSEWDWCYDNRTLRNKVIYHPDGDYHFVDDAGMRHYISNPANIGCLTSRLGQAAAEEVRWRDYIERTPEGDWAICGDSLYIGWKLDRGQSIRSADGRYTLRMQSGDGHLVLYNSSGSPIWYTNVAGGKYAVLNGDGNFVVYNASGGAIWSTGTAGSGGDRFVIQSDGNLVLYDGSRAVWASNTVGR